MNAKPDKPKSTANEIPNDKQEVIKNLQQCLEDLEELEALTRDDQNSDCDEPPSKNGPK